MYHRHFWMICTYYHFPRYFQNFPWKYLPVPRPLTGPARKVSTFVAEGKAMNLGVSGWPAEAFFEEFQWARNLQAHLQFHRKVKSGWLVGQSLRISVVRGSHPVFRLRIKPVWRVLYYPLLHLSGHPQAAVHDFRSERFLLRVEDDRSRPILVARLTPHRFLRHRLECQQGSNHEWLGKVPGNHPGRLACLWHGKEVGEGLFRAKTPFRRWNRRQGHRQNESLRWTDGWVGPGELEYLKALPRCSVRRQKEADFWTGLAPSKQSSRLPVGSLPVVSGTW